MIALHFSKREKVIFIIAFMALLVYVIYLLAYVPLQKQAASLKSKIHVAEVQLKKNLKIIRKSEVLEKQYKEILANFRQTVSDEQVMTSVLSEIESVAGKIDLHIADKKPKKPRKIDFYNSFAVSLSLEGELIELMEFIYILQNPPHMFHIDEVSLSRKSTRKTGLRCRLVLSRTLIP